MRFFFLLIALALLLFVRCSIETAKEPASSYLHIATDVFKQKDAKLFDAFTKQTGTKIRFHHMSPDSLKNYIKQKKYTCLIDMAIYANPFRFETMRHEKLIDYIKSSEIGNESKPTFQTVVPLFRNALCLIQKRDTAIVKHVKVSSSKLLQQPISTTLTKKEMHLLAMTLTDKKQREEMLSAIYRNKLTFSAPLSVSNTKMLVLRNEINSISNRKRLYIKPLENPINYTSAAVLKHGDSYMLSINFINHIKKTTQNGFFT